MTCPTCSGLARISWRQRISGENDSTGANEPLESAALTPLTFQESILAIRLPGASYRPAML